MERMKEHRRGMPVSRGAQDGGPRESPARRPLGRSDPQRVKRLSAIAGASVALAVVAALYGAGASVSAQAAVSQAKADARPTLTAAADIKAGEQVSLAMLEVREVPQGFRASSALSDEALSDGGSVVGRRALVDIAAGSQVLPSFLSGAAGSGYLAAAIGEGMQAVTVAVDAETGLSGQLRPGDAVRVLAVESAASGEPAATTVCQRVRVLSLDGRLSGSEGGYASVTLEVEGSQADAIRAAQHAGSVGLVLVSSADALKESGAVDG